ncbi:MAG: hypothetical protein ABSD42_10670 [Candidatus Bathyarchaeia archaeon]|jgi:hypothetical protein
MRVAEIFQTAASIIKRDNRDRQRRRGVICIQRYLKVSEGEKVYCPDGTANLDHYYKHELGNQKYSFYS